MTHRFFLLDLLFWGALWLLVPSASGADRVRIVVDGTERGTNASIARSIATHVAKPAGIDLEMRYSNGPYDTLVRLREGSGQQFAVLQADVAPAFAGAAARGSLEAGELLAPVRVIAPLAEEDIYFVARSDSPFQFVHEVQNARINVGPLNSSTALSVANLYRLMFDSALPEQRTTFHSHQSALIKLTEQNLDVVALVAPRPARLLAEMTSEARRFVKLLKFDAGHPSASSLLKVYSSTTAPAANYPNLLDDELPVLTVGIYLVSHGRNDGIQSRFANSWCQNLPRLRDQGHPALRGLDLALPPLTAGWHYSRPFENELTACAARRPARAESCSQEDRALGLCG